MPAFYSLLFFSIFTSYSIFGQCPQIVWQDEFEGSELDLDKWNIQLGDGCDIQLCGWGNNELQSYQAENAVVENGILKIQAKREQVGNRSYTSSRINTKGKADFTFGRFEARMKLPQGQGLWPAFWMLSTDEPYGTWPQSGEIDIMELIGSDPATTHGTIHFGMLPNNKSSTDKFTLAEGLFNDQFHTFAIEWESSQIRWYLDDILFSTKIRSVTGGSRWPFDHDFHFLLNLAVGGNWPGPPNSTTEFPQAFEIDYVRVFDGYFPSISGSVAVDHREGGTKYKVNHMPDGVEITWQVPESAQIVSGQGTNEISIDWGEIGGYVHAIYTGSCGLDTLSIPVSVAAPFTIEESFENFDDMASITFKSSTGSLTDEVTNPQSNSINTSAFCGKYDRNSSELFDVLTYEVTVVDDASVYITGEKQFYIDVYTDAPVGTLILLQMENSQRSQPTNYPSGRHSRFQAVTSKQNEWERLRLELLDQPDLNTSSSSIDQFVFLFASNSNLNSTFYFDNFDSYAQATTVSTNHSDQDDALLIYPNPSTDFLILENKKMLKGNAIIYDLHGRMTHSDPVDITEASQLINISHLTSGIYFLKLISTNNRNQILRFTKS